MRILAPLYRRVLHWSAHPRAPVYLGMLSFAESSFFPVPPDIMLAPMTLARRDRAWRYAALTTAASVLGGIMGYLVGMFLFAQIGQPVIDFYDAQEKFEDVRRWFDEHGVWVVLIAGFTPIPYKLFTITSGVMAMALLPFTVASVIGRGARFFLVAGVIYWGGERFANLLDQRIDEIGWGVVAAAVVAWLVLH